MIFNGFLPLKGHLEFSGAFFLAEIFEKVSRDLVASTGHLWRILKEGNALKVLESERLRTLKLVGIECLILVHSRKFVFLTFFAICS